MSSSTDTVEASLQEQDQELKKKFELMTSIKGVGKVLAIILLVYTHGFNKMEDSRKLACYCGVTPFGPADDVSIGSNTEMKQVCLVKREYPSLPTKNSNGFCTWFR